jgi:hypothetical protein
MNKHAGKAFEEGVRQALEVLQGKAPAKAAEDLMKALAKLAR